MALRKSLPIALIGRLIKGAFNKKQPKDAIAAAPAPEPSNGYYRLYPYNGGWQYQRVADNNRATTTSQRYDYRSEAMAGIMADRKLYNLPIREAKYPLPE
jgi:hypothetical protein